MFERSKIRFFSAIILISLLWGCSQSPLKGNTVATINNDVITESVFENSYLRTLKIMNLDPKTLQDAKYQPMVEMFKKITLQNLILFSLIQQEAKERGITVSPKEVEETFQVHITQVGGEQALKQQLEKIGMSEKEFKRELEEQLLKDKVVSAVAKDKIKVSESEAKAYYQAHPSQFDHAEQVRARHILIAADPQQVRQDILKLNQEASPQEIEKQVQAAMADKRKKAESLYQQVVLSPQSFEELAKKHSNDTESAKQGGDLGYFSQEVMVPSFSKAAFSTKPSQIHQGVVSTPFGYHIIQVLDRKAPQKRKFEDVKAQIIQIITNQRKNQAMEAWIEAEKKKAKIVIAPEYNFEKQAQKNPKPSAVKPQ